MGYHRSFFVATVVILTGALFMAFSACRDDNDGSKRMAERLRALNEAMNPMMNPYVNDRRVEYIRGMPVPSEPRQRLSHQATLAHELLFAGETPEAIELLEGIKAVFQLRPELSDPLFSYKVDALLGISYLRLGEQQNCQLNHTSYSCIVPIQSQAVHQLQQGSTKAIEFYTGILRQHPRDFESRWLLNVAYMTLGRHPQDVPAEWLIPASAFESEYDIGRFFDVAPALGLDTKTLSGGCVVEDFDHDGDLDVMISSFGPKKPLHYFEHSAGTFVEKSHETGLDGLVGGLNLVTADYNNDGNVDVFVLRGAWQGQAGEFPNSLLRNNGDGTFSDVTDEAGLLSFHPTQAGAWGDYNNDGWLDLAIASEATPGNPHLSELYENNGDGTFTNVAAAKGVAVTGHFKGVAWGDINNNGFPDLYLSNLKGRNYMFLNQPAEDEGVRTFVDVTEKLGVSGPEHGFPVWFWDYDNDGWEDLLVLTYSGYTPAIAAAYLGEPYESEMPVLYHNNGDGTFTDVAKNAGLDFPLTSMGANFGDLDNDGFLDFYVGTGEPNMRAIVPNRMYRNDGGQRFQDVTTSGGFGHLQKGHAIVFADMDHDGDQDVFSVMGGAYSGDIYQNVLFQNPGHGNSWVALTLEGSKSNRSAIGARIKVVARDGTVERAIHRTVSTGGSFGANPLRQEIGLGKAAEIDRIEVYWPTSGIKQTFENVIPARHYVVREQENHLIESDLPEIKWNLREGDARHHQNMH